MILIAMSDIENSATIRTRIVKEDSRAAALAVEFSNDIIFAEDTEFQEFEKLLDESTFLSNNLPCEITAVFKFAVIY